MCEFLYYFPIWFPFIIVNALLIYVHYQERDERAHKLTKE